MSARPPPPPHPPVHMEIVLDANNNDDDDEVVIIGETAVEVLHVVGCGVRRVPMCRCRLGQPVCLSHAYSCRMSVSVAILALDAGSLTIRNGDHQVQVLLQPGLHLFTWCVANMLFCGLPLSWPADRPQMNCGEFTISDTEPDRVTWMPLAATFRRMRVPGPRSYVFALE
jgi:hypothetical protein